MTLVSLDLVNFRRHARLHLAYGPVTAILGPNRGGKTTAGVEALRWVLYNDAEPYEAICGPVGPAVAVTATLADGTTVERYRDKRSNRYTITRPGHAPEVYERVGAGPLAEVLSLTGCRPLVVGGTRADLHFQGVGFTGPLDLPPVELTQLLGALNGAAAVEAAQRAAAAEARTAQTQRTQAETARARAEAEVAALAGVADLDPLVAAVHRTQADWAGAVATRDRWRAARAQWDRLATDRSHALDACEIALRGAETAATALSGAQATQRGWRAAADRWRTLEATSAEHLTAADAADRAFAEALAAAGVCPLCGAPTGG